MRWKRGGSEVEVRWNGSEVEVREGSVRPAQDISDEVQRKRRPSRLSRWLIYINKQRKHFLSNFSKLKRANPFSTIITSWGANFHQSMTGSKCSNQPQRNVSVSISTRKVDAGLHMHFHSHHDVVCSNSAPDPYCSSPQNQPLCPKIKGISTPSCALTMTCPASVGHCPGSC